MRIYFSGVLILPLNSLGNTLIFPVTLCSTRSDPDEPLNVNSWCDVTAFNRESAGLKRTKFPYQLSSSPIFHLSIPPSPSLNQRLRPCCKYKYGFRKSTSSRQNRSRTKCSLYLTHKIVCSPIVRSAPCANANT